MEHIELIYEISNVIVDAKTHDEALSQIAKHLRNFLESDVCSFYLLNRSEDQLTLAATDGLNQDAVGNVSMATDEGLTGQVYTDDKFTYVNDAMKHERFKYFPGIGEEPFNTFIGLPLRSKDRHVGVLVFQFAQSRNYSPIMEKLLMTIGSIVSGLIQQFDILEFGDDAETMTELVDYELTGVALSDGIVVGKPVHIIYNFAESVKGEFDSEEEIKEVQQSFVATVEELKVLIRKIERSSEDMSTEIFRTHLMMLKDGSYKNDIIHHIAKYNKGGAFSIRHVSDKFIRKFRSFEDVYLRERAADIEDICQRLLKNLGALHKKAEIKENSIIIADRLTPGETASLDMEKVIGFITEKDGSTSHTAILARSREIPAVSGIQNLLNVTEFAELIIMDGHDGKIIINPSEETQRLYDEKRKSLQPLTQAQDPQEHIDLEKYGIKLYANVSSALDAEKSNRLNAGGIGLVRTEIFYLQKYGQFCKDTQVGLYSEILDKFDAGTVIFRLLDIGADKTIERKVDEDNPAMGLRGARLLLEDTELLLTQIEALIEVSNHERVKILVPFITELEEFIQIKSLIVEQYTTAGKAVPEIGVMIEIPSAVFILDELLVYADFFSVGTNDLFQYFCAVDRNNTLVSNAYDPTMDAFIRLLKMIHDKIKPSGKDVEICGEVAADPFMLEKLLEIGYNIFSINPYSVTKTRKAIDFMMRY